MPRHLLMSVVLAWSFASSPLYAQAGETLDQKYLDAFVKLHDAENFEKKDDLAGALKAFKESYNGFAAIRQEDSDWQSVLVTHRMNDATIMIQKMETMLKDQALAAQAPASGAALSNATAAVPPTSSHDLTSATKTKLVYPWKTNIVTTVFWIGEGSSGVSAWNEKWAQSNGGADTPDSRRGYASGDHASGTNPFYVALPFNDLAHPDKARQWVPAEWQRSPKNGKPVSACKDRWVEIKTEDGMGRVCYAQWEDVGPLRQDHAEYVFGTERPAGKGAGIDISPAVAQYLGLGGEQEPIPIRWRFVDDADVPPGIWLKYDEQAVIYTALHQSKDTDIPSDSDTTRSSPASNPTNSPSASTNAAPVMRPANP